MSRQRPPFRADQVGSLLRPRPLLDARERKAKGEIDAAELRAQEDAAIAEVVKFQEDVGLQGITDGEFRRTWFHVDFLERIDGIEATYGHTAASFHKDSGEDLHVSPPRLKVTGKLARSAPIMLDDYRYLAGQTARTPKITMPSPSMGFRGGREQVDKAAYPDLDGFYEDLAAVYRAELKDLADAGCTYVQLDDTNLAYLCDPAQREGYRASGQDPDALPRLYADLINASIRDVPEGMTTAIHLCRGNYRSAWVAEGGYDPVAEVLFGGIDVDAFFLEYDDPRSGGFGPLRYVPKGKTVVLGLVSTKRPQLEDADELKRRIDQAATEVPLEQLCISPQCGFSSTHHGNDITVDDQRRKLELCVKVAEDVWGAV